LPNKNILELHGHPLIYWSIAFAQAQRSIDRCIVSTDSPAIAQVAQSYGAEVPFLRSDVLSSDTAKTADVLLDVIRRCSLDGSDKILLLEPTSPYRTQSSFDQLLRLFERGECRKAVSVSEAVSSSFVFQYNVDFNGKSLMVPVAGLVDANGLRRQDIQKAYYLDGTFYMSYVDSFVANPGFIDSSTNAVLSDYFSSFEIDCENDFSLMEAIFSCVGTPF